MLEDLSNSSGGATGPPGALYRCCEHAYTDNFTRYARSMHESNRGGCACGVAGHPKFAGRGLRASARASPVAGANSGTSVRAPRSRVILFGCPHRPSQ